MSLHHKLASMILLFFPLAALAQTSEPSTEPAIKADELYPTIPWEKASEHMNEQVFLVGKITQTSKARGGNAFLNFEKKKGSLVLFISSTAYKKFEEPPEKTYRDKTVKVLGTIIEFRAAPEISITDPKQIEILPDDAKVTFSPPREKTETKTGDTITIGSYNVLNLFDSYDDPYTQDEGTPAKPRAQMEALGKSIRELNADVLALTEVENRGILQQFVSAFLSDMNYDVVLFEGNDTRGIDVAVLSRLPVGEVTSHRHLRFPNAKGQMMRYHRDLLEVHIEPENYAPFEMFVVHLKSKGGDENGGIDDRLGEARETRKIFDQKLKENPQSRFVLCGDFNDTFESEPLKTIVGQGPLALTPFVNDLPPGDNISFNQAPFLSMIDFIFASPAMSRDYQSHTYHIVIGGSPETTGSDHNPVFAKFHLEPPTSSPAP